ncbi:MAG: rhodanese-like domain-containing protein [Acidimicrobiales bacterium]
MRTIDRETLRERLDRGDGLKLVLALPDWAFQASHIVGSIHVDNTAQLLSTLDRDDEIVVYCSDPSCIASTFAYHELVAAGFTDVARYEGGLSDWAAAGYPLTGSRHDVD